MIFTYLLTKSVGPRQFSAEKVILQTDGLTDELIWGGLGNLVPPGKYCTVETGGTLAGMWAGGTDEINPNGAPVISRLTMVLPGSLSHLKMARLAKS
jgi:hypothetical protein